MKGFHWLQWALDQAHPKLLNPYKNRQHPSSYILIPTALPCRALISSCVLWPQWPGILETVLYTETLALLMNFLPPHMHTYRLQTESKPLLVKCFMIFSYWMLLLQICMLNPLLCGCNICIGPVLGELPSSFNFSFIDTSNPANTC